MRIHCINNDLDSHIKISLYVYVEITAIFRALADPTRVRILALLRTMELSIGELAQVLGQSQPRISHHAKILIGAGLATRRKEGSWVFLSPTESELIDPVYALLDHLQAAAGNSPQTLGDKVRLEAIRSERAAEAERYFARHAAHWDELRALHIGESKVEAAIARALEDRSIGRLLDIGTGTGRMLELFAGDADRALGIDRSPEMLRMARAKLAEGVNAELRQGDMYALPLPASSADTIVIHQVLHYAQQPGAAIAEAARVLAPGGRLLIVDFAPHDREELRDRAAHIRLGFEDDAMLKWLKAAGLRGRVVEHLKGGELTVTLWVGEQPKGSRLKVVA
jgi:ArsR family transcriptional regulator